MNSMNEQASIMEMIKGKACQVLADSLIYEGEQGVKRSTFLVISESVIPIELMREDA